MVFGSERKTGENNTDIERTCKSPHRLLPELKIEPVDPGAMRQRHYLLLHHGAVLSTMFSDFGMMLWDRCWKTWPVIFVQNVPKCALSQDSCSYTALWMGMIWSLIQKWNTSIVLIFGSVRDNSIVRWLSWCIVYRNIGTSLMSPEEELQ